MGRRNRKVEFVELDIESIGSEGVSVAKKDGMVYFCKRTVPGDKVKAKIIKKKKNYAEALLNKVIEPSKDRIEPKCKYFDYCGGCSWQIITYEDQLKWKAENVQSAFRHIGQIDFGEILPTLPSPREYHFRNKMEFTFGASRWMMPDEIENEEHIVNKNFGLGLHVPGRFDKIVDLSECLIQTEYANQWLDLIRNKALDWGITAHHARAHKGFLKNFVVRYSLLHDNYMIILITDEIYNNDEDDFVEWFLDTFENEYDKVVSVVHAENMKVTPTAYGKIKQIRGATHLEEEILGVKFKISPFSFFQTNPFQLNPFIGKALEMADLKKDEIVWDLYCGTGSITLPAASRCKEIIGIELIDSSIADAKKNAKANNIENVEFYCEDLHKKQIPELLNTLPRPDTVIIDPPRAGMHKYLLEHLLELEPKKIVYVSCNPSTQARDCQLLEDKYTIGDLQPVDLFPQTYHIENITVLELKPLICENV